MFARKVNLVFYLLTALFATCYWSYALAETLTSGSLVTMETRLFKIGYLPEDPEAQLGIGAIHELREFLLAQPNVREAMQNEGIEDISLLAVDRHEAMVERMNRNEFDLAFCSAVDFVLQNGDYDARFQLRRPQDSFDPKNSRVFHKGVIFISNRHPYFNDPSKTPQEFADTISTMPLALVSGSAAGFYYPSLKIARLSSKRHLPQFVHLCDSSEEVVKTVLNGLGGAITAGACEKAALEQVLTRYRLLDKQDQLVRVVIETDPIPGEPVVLHRQWSPRLSSLGRSLAEAMQRFFSESRGLPRLEHCSNDKFQDLRANLREFWLLVGRKPSKL